MWRDTMKSYGCVAGVRTGIAMLSSVFIPVLGGCGAAAPNISLAVAGGTVLAGQMPGQEIEQVYYLGVFDPRDQVPPTVYRLTVRGQASGISNMKFGSGWVQASLIDSLNSHVGFDGNGATVTQGSTDPFKTITPGRRLMLFGPEGFREAPKDHRLVIVMGSSPEKFFKAIDEGLAVVTQAQREKANSEVSVALFKAMSDIRNEQKRLDDLSTDVAADLPKDQGGAK
jgi:hypothetical protein